MKKCFKFFPSPAMPSSLWHGRQFFLRIGAALCLFYLHFPEFFFLPGIFPARFGSGAGPNLIQRIICPFYNMKEVNAPFCVWKIFFRAWIDPSGPIAGNYLNFGSFFLCQQLAELGKYFLPVVLVYPNDTIPVHVIHYSDIWMSFSITGLIYTNAAESSQPRSDIGFNPVMRCFHAIPDSSPVDACQGRHRQSGHLQGHPGHFIVKRCGKSAVSVFPGKPFWKHTVFRAFYPTALIKEIYRNPIHVICPPPTLFAAFGIISRALSAAFRATPLVSFDWTQMYMNLLLIMPFTKMLNLDGHKVLIFYMDTIEIDYSFEYTE